MADRGFTGFRRKKGRYSSPAVYSSQLGLLGGVHDVDDVDDVDILVDGEEHPVGYHQLGAKLMAMEKALVAGGARSDLQLVDRGVDAP